MAYFLVVKGGREEVLESERGEGKEGRWGVARVEREEREREGKEKGIQYFGSGCEEYGSGYNH